MHSGRGFAGLIGFSDGVVAIAVPRAGLLALLCE
jgi:hypothetical protein